MYTIHRSTLSGNELEGKGGDGDRMPWNAPDFNPESVTIAAEDGRLAVVGFFM
jgi:hypothetical protein